MRTVFGAPVMVLNDTVLDWFCLINTKGVGAKTFWSLMNTYKTASEVLKHVENPFLKIEAEKRLKNMDCDVILADDEIFPKSLRRSNFCPPLLFYKGDKSILSRRMLAIIGARNASMNGQKIARNLASRLTCEFAIVSGLAKGIDTSAHIGSLVDPPESEKSAIAIVPFGFDNIYPKENQRLFHEIAEKGLVLSEVPYGKPVDQGMFQARNRIISLISEGIIVIEAGYKSGTMATATMALEFGCEIMVVPGTPTDPRNLGSNSLIKNGANLIQNHFDVLEILGSRGASPQKYPVIKQSELPIQSSKTELLSLLSETPVSIDELSVRLSIGIQELLCLISELELSGDICRTPKNEIVLSGRL